jgi:hypothetical protein
MTLQPGGLIWNTEQSRMASDTEAGVCGVRPRKRPASLDVHATVFQAEISVILACARECTETNYSLLLVAPMNSRLTGGRNHKSG